MEGADLVCVNSWLGFLPDNLFWHIPFLFQIISVFGLFSEKRLQNRVPLPYFPLLSAPLMAVVGRFPF
jgi:hypothetical protein